MMEDSLNYRQQLVEEYLAKKAVDAGFSMRKFAGKLGLSPSFLHRMLAGKKNLSAERAYTIAAQLNWPDKKLHNFLNLVNLERAKSSPYKEYVERNLPRMEASNAQLALKDDRFQIVSEWHYGAIFELLGLAGFQTSTANIAQRLNLEPMRIQLALDRLEDLGLIRKMKQGYVRTKKRVFFGDVPSRFVPRYHQQMLMKAEHALRTQDFSLRDFSGITLAVNLETLPEVRQAICQFRQKIKDITQQGPANKVMHLSVQFFSLEKEPPCADAT